MTFTLKSSAFGPDEPIPDKYSAYHQNLSPPLEWTDAPPDTKSFALIVEDPDAPSGMFSHWGVYDIARKRDRLPEGIGHGGARTEQLGAGVNGFGHSHYDGPRPPKGHGVHHYHFRLFALDVETLPQAHRARVEDVREEARKHAIAEVELVGTYQR